MPRRYEDGPAQLGAIALLYQQHGFKGAKLMVVSVDQRILCVNNVETVFLGVTIKVQDEILEREDRKSTRLELQSLMRISYAVFCLTKNNKNNNHTTQQLNEI